MPLKDMARQIPGQVDSTQEDQLRHLLQNLQDKVQLQRALEEWRSSAGTLTCRCQGRVCGGIHVAAGWDQCWG